MVDRFVRATPAVDGNSPSVLTTEQIASWRSAGFSLVDGILPADLIDTLAHAGADHFPTAGSSGADQIDDFGSAVNFPSRLSGFNEITLHPRILTAVSQLIDRPVSDLRLSQSDVWPKYGRAISSGSYDNQDQRIHIDYPNHTIAHPARWDQPEAVEMIVYLSDVEHCQGSTAVVPRSGPDDPAYRWPIVDSPGIGDLRYINDRAAAEDYFAHERPELATWRKLLYERERWTHFTPGTVLFYRHDTWHRGTPLAPGSVRLVHNMTYRLAECEWISTLHIGWAWAMYRDDKHMERLIANASLDQRAVLGFPQPGNAYWDDYTIAAVEARYGMLGMDMSPYREAIT